MPPSNDGRSRDRVRKQTLPQSTGTDRGGFPPSGDDLTLGTPSGMAVYPLHFAADRMSFRRKIA